MLFFVISPFVCPLLLHTPACDDPENTADCPGQLVVLGWASGGREVPRLHVDEAFMNILHEMYHISMIYQSSPLPPIYQVFWPGLPPSAVVITMEQFVARHQEPILLKLFSAVQGSNGALLSIFISVRQWKQQE